MAGSSSNPRHLIATPTPNPPPAAPASPTIPGDGLYQGDFSMLGLSVPGATLIGKADNPPGGSSRQ